MLRPLWRESMRQLLGGNIHSRVRSMSKRRRITWVLILVITALDLAAVRFHLNMAVLVLSCVWLSILWYVIGFVLCDRES